LTTLGFNLDQA